MLLQICRVSFSQQVKPLFIFETMQPPNQRRQPSDSITSLTAELPSKQPQLSFVDAIAFSLADREALARLWPHSLSRFGGP